ncbi:hypothetical protein HDU96_008503 [Phlyctochytrium bullatum]|nr:hypothetical protein HDU96_008503 [Phlyctochytrium bullatum]
MPFARDNLQRYLFSTIARTRESFERNDKAQRGTPNRKRLKEALNAADAECPVAAIGVFENLDWPKLPVTYWAALVTICGFTASTLNLLRGTGQAAQSNGTISGGRSAGSSPFPAIPENSESTHGASPSGSMSVPLRNLGSEATRSFEPPLVRELTPIPETASPRALLAGPPAEPNKRKVAKALYLAAVWRAKASKHRKLKTPLASSLPKPPKYQPAATAVALPQEQAHPLAEDHVDAPDPSLTLHDGNRVPSKPAPLPGLEADSFFALRYLARINDADTLAQLLMLRQDELEEPEEALDGFYPLTPDLELGLQRALVSAAVAGSADVIQFLQQWWLGEAAVAPLRSPVPALLKRPSPQRVEVCYPVHASSALVASCHWGQENVTMLFLAAGHVDFGAGRNRALRCAADAGWEGIVRCLLETGKADPTDCEGEALLLACQNGHVAIVRLILEWLAVDRVRAAGRTGTWSLSEFVDPPDHSDSPLILAAMHGHLEVARLLLEALNCEPESEGVAEVPVTLASPTVRRTTLETAIEMASCAGHVAAAAFFIDTVTQLYTTPPSHACLCTSVELAVQAGRLPVVQLLLERFGTPSSCSVSLDPSFREGMLLREAATRGYADIVKYLLDKGVDPGLKGNAALKWAAFHGHVEVVRLLLSVPTLVPSFPCNEPLHFASLMNRAEVVRLLQDDPRMLSEVVNT